LTRAEWVPVDRGRQRCQRDFQGSPSCPCIYRRRGCREDLVRVLPPLFGTLIFAGAPRPLVRVLLEVRILLPDFVLLVATFDVPSAGPGALERKKCAKYDEHSRGCDDLVIDYLPNSFTPLRAASALQDQQETCTRRLY
jgi:hypothetical protein